MIKENKWQADMKEGLACALHIRPLRLNSIEYMNLNHSINNGLQETDINVGHCPITDKQRADTKAFFETMLK